MVNIDSDTRVKARALSQAGGRRAATGLLVLVLVFVTWHAAATARYLHRVSAEHYGLESLEIPRAQVPVGTAYDLQNWIRLGEELESGRNGWRLRESSFDNVPEGRPVYWNSAWAWWLILCGHIREVVTGESFPTAMEQAVIWANLPMLIASVGLLVAWIWRRWGAWPAAVFGAVLVGHRGFYEGFSPGNADHHGMIAVCAAGLALGVVIAGGGWHRRGERNDPELSGWPEDEQAVRDALTLSAVCGAVGMWFSAASLIPVLGTLAVVVLLAGRPGGALVASAGGWRHWGRLGGGLCLFFYLLEQFPDRLGWRLEVNHPVYALAWVGTGEFLAVAAEWRSGSLSLGALARRRWFRLGVAAIGVILPLCVVLWRGAVVFALLDPTMKAMHSHVSELSSLLARIRFAGLGYYIGYAILHPLLLLIAGFAAWRLRGTRAGYVVRVVWGLAVLMVAFGWLQNRWMLLAGGLLALLASVCVRGVGIERVPAWPRLPWIGVLAVLAAFWQPVRYVVERLDVEARRDVQTDEAVQLLYREAARVLRADASGRRVSLLAAPDASTGVSYYGDFSSYGTIYWENSAGLAKAAAMLTSTDMDDVSAMIRRWGVTHVAVFGFDGGGSVYFTDQAHIDDKHAFGPGLLAGNVDPDWLRPIPYATPPQFGRYDTRVRLFAVDFDQRPAEAAYRHGLAAAGYGQTNRALRCFKRSVSLAPEKPAPWMRLAEVQLGMHDVTEAKESMLRGIAVLPVEQRETAYLEAAKLFGTRGARHEADAFLDRAVASGQP